MYFIKIFLVFLLVLIYLVFRRYLHGKRLVVRSISVLMLSVAILAVVFPGLSTRCANIIGIGRGADLIIYFMIIFLMFTIIVLHGSLSQTKITMTQLAREITFMQARPASSFQNKKICHTKIHGDDSEGH